MGDDSDSGRSEDPQIDIPGGSKTSNELNNPEVDRSNAFRPLETRVNNAPVNRASSEAPRFGVSPFAQTVVRPNTQSAGKDLIDYEYQIAKLQAEIKTANSSIENANAQLKAKTAEVGQLENKLAVAHHSIDSLKGTVKEQSKLEYPSRATKNLEEQLQQRSLEVTALRPKLAEAHRGNQDLQGKLKQSSDDAAKLRSELESAKSSVKTFEGKLKGLVDDKAKLQSELDSAKSSIKDLEGKLKVLVDDKVQLQSDLEELRGYNDDLNKRLQSETERADNASTNHVEVRSSGLRTELAQAKQKITRLEEELNTKCHELGDARTQILNHSMGHCANSNEGATNGSNESQASKRKRPDEQSPAAEDFKRLKLQPRLSTDTTKARNLRFQDQIDYEYLAWELQIKAKIDEFRANSGSDEEAQLYLINNLSRHAGERLAATLNRYPTMPVKEILANLRKYYVDPGLVAMNRVEYKALKQDKETIWEFVKVFQKLADRGRVPEEERVKDLGAKLAPRFGDAVRQFKGDDFHTFVARLRFFELQPPSGNITPAPKPVVKIPTGPASANKEAETTRRN